MKTIKLLLPLVAASLASLASASERVTVGTDVPSVIVKYDAAALGTRAGVKDLHGRLLVAARSVCTELDNRILGLREQYEHCVRDAVRRSVADVGNENLTNFHRYRTLPHVLASN